MSFAIITLWELFISILAALEGSPVSSGLPDGSVILKKSIDAGKGLTVKLSLTTPFISSLYFPLISPADRITLSSLSNACGLSSIVIIFFQL